MKTIVLSCGFAFLAAAGASAAPQTRERKTPQLFLKDGIPRILNTGDQRGYLSSVIDSGYAGVDLEMIEPDGSFYFNSRTLEDLAWNFKGDALGPIYAEWKRSSKLKRAAPIGMSLNVANLARITSSEDIPAGLFRPSVNQLDDALFHLLEAYRVNELSSVSFPPEYMPVMLGSFRNIRCKLNWIAAPPNLDRYVQSPEYDYASILKYVQRFTIQEADLSDPKELGRSAHSIGFASLMFLWAKTINKPASLDIGYEHASWRNLVLFRAAQYAPAGLAGTEQDFNRFKFSGLKRDVDEFYGLGQSASPAGRKMANLILGTKKEKTTEPLISEYIDPILNALEANGYEVRVTFGTIEEGADLYYVVNGKDWLADMPFFDSILDLMDHRRSRFYGTVVLHPMGEILNDGPWARLRKIFNIPNAEGGWINDLPDSILIKMISHPWEIGGKFSGRGMTRLREAQARQLGAEVVLSQVFDGATLGLIFKAGPHYLINGNFLHLGASYFLSNLMGGAMQSASPVYVSANRKRTSALAVEAARFKFKPPVPDAQTPWTLSYFDADGERVRQESLAPRETLEFDMKPFELLILRTEE